MKENMHNEKTTLERIQILEKSVLSRDELKGLMKETIKEVFIESGKTAKVIIISVATIIAAIAVIGGGFKWVLGLIGFHFIK